MKKGVVMVVKESRHDVDRLLEISEIKEAMDRYQEIQAEYRQALFDAVRAAPGNELPDVEEIRGEYDTRLKAQRAEVMSLVHKHI